MINKLFFIQVDVTSESTTLHINDPNDYLGRNYLHPPQDEAVNLNKPGAPARCFLPKKLIHTYKGHNKVCLNIFISQPIKIITYLKLFRNILIFYFMTVSHKTITPEPTST